MAMASASLFKFDDSDIINIPNNGITHSTTWKALKMSNLIKTSFEDIFFNNIYVSLGENITDEHIIKIDEIPEGIQKTITLIGESYNTVEKQVFSYVIELISYYSIHGTFHETAFKKIHEVSLSMLFDVYKASNFLDIPELLDGCAEYIASLIKNKTEGELQALFN